MGMSKRLISCRPPVAAKGIEEAIEAEIPLVVWYELHGSLAHDRADLPLALPKGSRNMVI